MSGGGPVGAGAGLAVASAADCTGPGLPEESGPPEHALKTKTDARNNTANFFIGKPRPPQ